MDKTLIILSTLFLIVFVIGMRLLIKDFRRLQQEEREMWEEETDLPKLTTDDFRDIVNDAARTRSTHIFKEPETW